MLSNTQKKYFAYELTVLEKDGKLNGISQALQNAQVDLNPHQIEAASFALHSPLSKGVVLADEVGLGKTIEAGIILCQYWAEIKRHLIIICPASLREQWKTELEEKFNLPAIIVDSKNYFSGIFTLTDKIIIISYNFAAKYALELVKISWNLAVLDEAHKLRNVYKEKNKIGQAIKQGLRECRKVLLTATPLQNSLMELYGLSLLIDENIFGNEKSFRAQYSSTRTHYDVLKERLATFCRRTLRSDVLEYIRYTKRRAITFPFNPSKKEVELYEKVSKFLQKDSLYAIPHRQKHLISLILYKLLASSSVAICNTLSTMLERMKKLKEGLSTATEDKLLNDELIEADMEDEIDESSDKGTAEGIDTHILDKEIAEIQEYIALAQSIGTDSKSEKLLDALQTGFVEMSKTGAPQKALIFTESRRTQQYLFNFLSAHGYAHKIVLFHGGNKLQRNELIRQFKEDASIMIATEAGAEGLNMQFCSLVINYDLPWNPQRVEQRIGRCHRYGQKYDVVVINFINQSNQADKRVFELLSSKFRLFEGVFGASDEILGSIEDGVDFENKILAIYQTCRTPNEINEAFDALKKEMETSINVNMRKTKQELLRNFDAEVHRRLRVNLEETKVQLSDKQQLFWRLAKDVLKNDGFFDEQDYSFTLQNAALGKCGKYYFIRQEDKHSEVSPSFVLRLSAPLGEHIIQVAKNIANPPEEITFDVSHAARRHLFLEKMQQNNQYGWGIATLLTINSFEKEEYLVLTGIDNYQKAVEPEVMAALLRLEPTEIKEAQAPLAIEKEALSQAQEHSLAQAKHRSEVRNMGFFKEESQKIESFCNDKLYMVEKEYTDVRQKIHSLNKEVANTEDYERSLALEKEIATLTAKRRVLARTLDDIEDTIEIERKQLIDNLRKHQQARIGNQNLFIFKWKLK